MNFKNLAETLVEFHAKLKEEGATEEFAVAMCGVFITVFINNLVVAYR